MNKSILIRHWAAPLALLLLSAILFSLQGQLLDTLEYNRSLITQGEWWRLITGNLLHTNAWHLLFNLLGLAMLAHLFGRYFTPTSFVLFSLLNSLLVGILLYFFTPDIEYYVGLSGYLHGVFVFGCLAEVKRGIKFSYLLLIGVGLKIAYENYFGSNQQMVDLIEASVATDAHLYGALAALPLFVLFSLVNNKKR
ncbi:MAG: rhombosortase [Psychrobium sp.]|nr:rhombosortase [Psychrobium sp.]